MKKVLMLVSAIVLALTLGGCSENETTTDYSNQIIMGRVSSIDGTLITIEFMNDQNGFMNNGPMNERFDDRGDMPPQDSNGMPIENQGEMPPQGPGDMPLGNPREMPPMRPENNEFNSNGQNPPMDRPDMKDNRFDDRQNNQFDNLKTLTIDLKDINVVFEDDFDETDDKDIADITVGSFIRIEFGDNNMVKSVTIQSFNDRPPFEGQDEIPFDENEVPFENAN